MPIWVAQIGLDEASTFHLESFHRFRRRTVADACSPRQGRRQFCGPLTPVGSPAGPLTRWLSGSAWSVLAPGTGKRPAREAAEVQVGQVRRRTPADPGDPGDTDTRTPDTTKPIAADGLRRT